MDATRRVGGRTQPRCRVANCVGGNWFFIKPISLSSSISSSIMRFAVVAVLVVLLAGLVAVRAEEEDAPSDEEMEGINNIVEDTIVIKAIKKQVRLSHHALPSPPLMRTR